MVDWVSTRYGAGPWKNAHDSGDVIVKCSSVKMGAPREFIDRTLTTQRLMTENEPFSWIQVELPIGVSPTHYRMSHSGGSDPATVLRSWAFCASYDGEDWRVLCQHTADTTLSAARVEERTGAWEVKLAKVWRTE